MFRGVVAATIKQRRHVVTTFMKRRKFSTDNTKKETTDDVSGVLSLVPTKYWLVIVPTIVISSIVSSIVNIEPLRDELEELCPAVVDMVRKYVGIDDADHRREKAWLRAVIVEQSHAVDAVITFEDGRQLVVPGVPGTMRYGDFVATLTQTLSASSAGSMNGNCIVNIEFVRKGEGEEAGDDNSSMAGMPSVDGGSTNSSSSSSGRINTRKIGDPLNEDDAVLPPEMHPEHPSRTRNFNADVRAPAINLVISEGVDPVLLRSLWEAPSARLSSSPLASSFSSPALSIQLASACTGGKGSGQAVRVSSSGEVDIQPDAPLSFRRALKYNNILQYVCGGLQLYDSRGGNLNTRTLRYKKPLAVAERSWQTANTQKGQSSSKKGHGPSAKALMKYDAEQMIASIDRDIAALREEQRGGGGIPSSKLREMDEIERDINELKARKTELQRKYINWFYYF